MKARSKHDWNSLENYLHIHEKVLEEAIDKSFVRGPTEYTVRKLTDQNWELSLVGLVLRSERGTEIEFKIEKSIEIDIDYARRRARTYDYSYHAFLPKPVGLNLVRYCSPHEHRPYHHKHLYNEDGSYQIAIVANEAWPHVSDFFEEVLRSF